MATLSVHLDSGPSAVGHHIVNHHRGALLALVLAGCSAAIACGESGPPELVFKVPLARLPQSMQRASQDLAPADSVELRLPGEWFDPPRELTVIAREAADLSSPLSASEAAYSAFKLYDDDWIVSSFAEEDRGEIRNLLANSGVRAVNRDYYEHIQGKRIHGWAAYVTDSTDYRLIFVSLARGSQTKRVETFVLESGEWRRTNRLVRNRAFQVAWNAYGSGTITQE